MKKRYVYVLVFGIPGLLAAAVVSTAVIGVIAGGLWIFVFGDNTWPSWTEYLLGGVLVLVFLGLWGASLAYGFVVGKRLEGSRRRAMPDVLLSAAAAAVLIAAAGLYEWHIGSVGAKPDEIRCAEFCERRGYQGSSMPPRDSGDRSCTCFDTSGRPAVTVPVEQIGGNR